MKDRDRKLIDIGSTTALSALVEIVAGSAERPKGSPVGAILSRQAKAMLARLTRTADQQTALEGFCDELQSWIESVPAARRTFQAAERTARRGR